MSAIEWTDETWNPTVGCSRVSAGCEHCYAERFAHRGLSPCHEGLTVDSGKGPRWTGEVRLLPERLDQPLHWRKPRRIFVDSMSDLFHESVPDEFIFRVFSVMSRTPQHTYQILTKRSRRMRQISRLLDLTMRPLPNVWLGVSVEDQAAHDKRSRHLFETSAAVRFLSIEPMLGPIELCRYLGDRNATTDGRERLLDWVIVGGESGPGARPCNVEWIRSIVKQCKAASVPVFVKQLGAKPVGWCKGILGAPDELYEPDYCDAFESGEAGHCGSRCFMLKSRKGADPDEWPEDLRVREAPADD